MTDRDIYDNRLIFGDSLLALKAQEAEFAGKVKCVFIDPPFYEENSQQRPIPTRLALFRARRRLSRVACHRLRLALDN
ncbi:MAG: hypothetical protein ACRERU_07205, partial [Methylococcales bacterium]